MSARGWTIIVGLEEEADPDHAREVVVEALRAAGHVARTITVETAVYESNMNPRWVVGAELRHVDPADDKGSGRRG